MARPVYWNWILVITATNRNGQNLNGHKPKRPQTGMATNRNSHKPEWPQTETATNRNGHKPKRPQTEMATDRNGHKPKRPQTGTATHRNGHKPKRPKIEIDTTIIWFDGLQICVLNRSFKLVSRSHQKQHSVTSEHGYGARVYERSRSIPWGAWCMGWYFNLQL